MAQLGTWSFSHRHSFRADFWNTEAAANFSREIVRDLGMARNRFDSTVRRVNP